MGSECNGQASGGFGHQPVGRAEDAFEAQIMSKARGYRIAAIGQLLQLIGAKLKQVRLGDRKAWVIAQSLWYPVRCTHDRAYVYALVEQSFNDQPSCRSAGTGHQDCLRRLSLHNYLEPEKTVPGVIHRRVAVFEYRG